MSHLHDGIQQLRDANQMIYRLRVAVVDGTEQTQHPDLPCAYGAREELLEQLCLIEDVIDEKLVLEAFGADVGVSFGPWPLSGTPWEWVCSGEIDQSPALQRQAQMRHDRQVRGR